MLQVERPAAVNAVCNRDYDLAAATALLERSSQYARCLEVHAVAGWHKVDILLVFYLPFR